MDIEEILEIPFYLCIWLFIGIVFCGCFIIATIEKSYTIERIK